MNERIKELAEQASGHNNISKFQGHFLPPPPDYIDPSTVDLEKFAELIVRECLSNMQNCNGDLDFAIWKTKKDFGIEE